MIDEALAQRVLAEATKSGGEWAEIFVEDRRNTNALLDDGRVEEMTSGRSRGAGIRVVFGETTGFAHTADLSEASLLQAAAAAGAVARQGGGGVKTVAFSPRTAPAPNGVAVLPESIGKAEKVALLQRANEAARSQGNAIVQVSAGYGDSRRRILVANTDGVWACDDQVRSLFRVSAVANGDGGMQTGYESNGFMIGWEFFDRIDVEEMGRNAANQALRKLVARPAPSGEVPVVIKQGSGGVMFHEACGHGLEADLVSKGASVFKDRVGQQVASALVTLVDTATMADEWGSFTFDDEGHPAGHNTLIQDGVLTDYMWDHLRSRKLGHAQSGNGRRQSYQHLPMVRMTNTFVKAGTTDPDAIVRDTAHGVYIAKLSGGQVNTATGDFVFGMSEAYLIENGEITHPLRDGNLIGNGPQVLMNIDVLGNDFAMGPPGMCGKDGQGVPVGDGQPTLRVPVGLSIGGTAA